MAGEFTVSCIQFTAIDGKKQATIEKALRLVRRRYPLLEQRRPELYSSIGEPRCLCAAAE
jgi:hypothetical protein